MEFDWHILKREEQQQTKSSIVVLTIFQFQLLFIINKKVMLSHLFVDKITDKYSYIKTA